MTLSDEQAMRLAMAQAATARAAGEVPVGAVLVRDGVVLATGANAPIALSDPTAHAEIMALRAAAASLDNYRLEGCTLYVTLEPCAMCAGAMLHARLARVVYGAADPRTGAAGSVTDLFAQPLLNHQTQVEGGLLAQECATQLQDFFRERRALQSRTAEPLREDALRSPRSAFSLPAAAAWEGVYRADIPALEGLRMHLVALHDTEPGPVFVCLHGPAGWGARFADAARALAGQGARVLVPDLIGFGRSDKPKRDDFHRLDWHVSALRQWLQAEGIAQAVLVAEAADPALAFSLAAEMGESAPGVVLLPGTPTDIALAHAPHPDRGHAAALRAFAAGWLPGTKIAEPHTVMRLADESPDALRQAVEYFRA